MVSNCRFLGYKKIFLKLGMCNNTYLINFTCVNVGMTPSKNKFYTPSADGCGALGLKIDTAYLPAVEMEECCNAHDICYDTCNSDKELCDLDFKRCLYKYCDSYEKSIVNDLVVKGCKGAAKMLFTGTLTLGCKSYLDSQARACYCPSATGNSKEQKNYGNGKREKDRKDYGNQQQKDKPNPKNYGWREDL